MELTNREAFFEVKKEAKNSNINISNSEIFEILERANGFKDYTEISLNFDKKLANIEYFLKLKEKLISGKPIQYILNSAPFVNLDLYVDKRVLIPRAETEELVTKVEFYIKKLYLNHYTIFDMCTGSGCIAIYLKSVFPISKVYASDISSDALDVAKINAKNNNVPIEFILGDKTEAIKTLHTKIDILVSNPPYVENQNDIEEKVKKYEPINAIYSKDGTSFYENVFQNYKDIMSDKFLMAFEINYDQEKKLTDLISKYFINDVIDFYFIKDMYGLTRFLFILKGYDNYENIN